MMENTLVYHGAHAPIEELLDHAIKNPVHPRRARRGGCRGCAGGGGRSGGLRSFRLIGPGLPKGKPATSRAVRVARGICIPQARCGWASSTSCLPRRPNAMPPTRRRRRALVWRKGSAEPWGAAGAPADMP